MVSAGVVAANTTSVLTNRKMAGWKASAVAFGFGAFGGIIAHGISGTGVAAQSARTTNEVNRNSATSAATPQSCTVSGDFAGNTAHCN